MVSLWLGGLLELKNGGSSPTLSAFPNSLLALPLFLPTSRHQNTYLFHLSRSIKEIIVSNAFPRPPSGVSALYNPLLSHPDARSRHHPPNNLQPLRLHHAKTLRAGLFHLLPVRLHKRRSRRRHRVPKQLL